MDLFCKVEIDDFPEGAQILLSGLGKGSQKKAAVLLDFVQMSGGEGPAQIFWHLFISAFLVNKKESISSKMPII